MKKMLLATGVILLITGCACTDVYCSNKPGSSSTKGNHHLSFSQVSGIGQKKLSMQPKFVAAQKMLLKQKPANIRKWIAWFYYQAFMACWKRVYCSHTEGVAHRYGQLASAIASTHTSGFLPVVFA